MMLFASLDFTQDFYCGAAMPRIDCVALDLDAQRTAVSLRVQTVVHLVTTWHWGRQIVLDKCPDSAAEFAY